MENLDYNTAIQDIDTRLKVANYFRTVLDSEILPTTDSEATLVRDRIRSFASNELATLMGVKKADQQSGTSVVSITSDELSTVKQLITLLTATLAKKTASQPTENTVQEVEVTTFAKSSDKKKTKKAEKDSKKEELEKMKSLVPKKYLDDPTLTFKEGRAFVHLKDGSGNFLFKEIEGKKDPEPILRDVTISNFSSANLPKPIPMPGPRYYEVMSTNAPPIGEALVGNVNAAIRSGAQQRSYQPEEQFIGSPDFNAD